MAFKRFILSASTLALMSCGGEDGSSIQGPESHRISTSVTGQGTVSPESADISDGSSAQMILQPEEGYTVATASGCNGSMQSNLYYISSVTQDCTVNVLFTEVQQAPAAQEEPDEEAPRVSGAVSAGNGRVIVQFNEPMAADLVDSVVNFNITRTDTQQILPVLAASFVDSRQQAVLLETGAQINTE